MRAAKASSAAFSIALLWVNASSVGNFGAFEYWFSMIKVVAIVLFLIFGIVMFFITKSQTADLLLKLAQMSPDATIPKPIGGKTYTAAALRSYLLWQPWGVLIVNLVLAAVMAILALWGRRAPLAALLTGQATGPVGP